MKAIVEGQMWHSSKKEKRIKEFPRPPSGYPAWMEEEGICAGLHRATEPKWPDLVEPRFVTGHRGTEPNTPWPWDQPCNGCGIRFAMYSLSWEYPPGSGAITESGTFCSAICLKRTTRSISDDVTRIQRTKQLMARPPPPAVWTVDRPIPHYQIGHTRLAGDWSKCIPLNIKVIEVGGNTPVMVEGRVYFPGYKAPTPQALQLQGAEPLEKRTRQGDGEDV